MMRYQRVSPDCLPLSDGKKPNLRQEDNSSSNGENGRTIPNGGFNSSSFDGGAKGFGFRSSSRAKDLNNNNLTHSGGSGAPTSPTPLSENNNHHENPKNQNQRLDASPSPSPSRGDVLLQWGQKKRSRVSRAEIRSVTVTDDSSSSSGQGKQPINTTNNKLQRRVLHATMPPPPPLPSTATSHKNSTSSRASHHRNGLLTSKESSGFISSRNLEERSVAANGSPSRYSGSNGRTVSRSAAGKRSPPSPDKVDRRISCFGSAKDEKQNGSIAQADRMDHSDSAPVQSEQETGATNTGLVGGAGEKVNVEVWPRIYIALSRKEKEDDFLVMKGTKLPHRPKKRAKNIDKALQYCFPGMWLSDLTKSRYEVREKKCAKKQKRRGLKGMESMDSDSE